MASESNGEARPATYDLIELREKLDGHAAGSRGTIVVEGMSKCLVDFAWAGGIRDVELQEPELRAVPYGAMKLVKPRPKLRERDLAQGGVARSQRR
jgi:hypothetical protein